MEKIEAFKEMDSNFERVRNILGDIFNIKNVKEELHNIIEIIKEQVESLNISGLIEKIDSVNDKIVTPLLEKIDVKKKVNDKFWSDDCEKNDEDHICEDPFTF